MAIEILQSLRTKLSEAIGSVTSTITDQRRRIDEHRKRIGALESSAVSREELEQRVGATVRGHGEYWMQEYGISLLHSERSPVRATVPNNFQFMPDENRLMSFGAFCASDPQGAAGLVLALYERAGYQPGPTASARAAELARLRKDLAELESTEERAIDDAIAAGVTIAHRPDVIARRQNEERQRQLDQERSRAQQQRQAAVNQAHERRFARSEYLEGK